MLAYTRRMLRASLALLLLLSSLSLAAQEADPVAANQAQTLPDRHALRLAELRSLKVEGEYVELMLAEGSSFALYLPDSSGKQHGTVLLLHDNHSHLAAQPIEALRVGLPRYGWDSFSVQLAPLGDEAGLEAWLDLNADHINAALAHLEGMGRTQLSLIGQGSGARLAIDYLFNTPRDRVQGLVVIGLDGSANENMRLDAARKLGEVGVPILDVYAARDQHRVLQSAARRASEAQRPYQDGEDRRVLYRNIAPSFDPDKGDQVHYRQLQIPATDHNYHPDQQALLKVIRGWLQRHAIAN